MAFTKEELDRLADDDYKGRRLHRSTFCGKCGYNLRTLPYVYTCPECGNQYNARPRSMEGIFSPSDAKFPINDVAASMVFSAFGIVLIWSGVSPTIKWLVVAGIAFCLLAAFCAWRSWGRISRLAHATIIARRIAEEDEDSP